MSDPYHWIHPHLPWRCQPMSHHTSNREVTTSRIPLQPISRSESPRDGTLGITRHWIQNDTNFGDKINQPNQLKLCQIFKWCQTFQPFFLSGNDWKILIHWDGKQVYIYVYINVFMFRQQKPSSVGWHSIEWWQVITWLAFIVGSCHNEWTAPQFFNGWCLLHPELTSFQWGVFGVSSWHALPSTSSATPPGTPPNQLNG